MPEYLTTSEVAALLRIKERKVYDLASSGQLPCSKAMGKLLFARDAVDAWIAGGEQAAARPSGSPGPRPAVMLGSHDPLLDWALRESGSEIASWFDGSRDGLDRFIERKGIATGLHLYNAKNSSWNITDVTECCANENCVLVEWAKRERGLILGANADKSVTQPDQIGQLRVVPRQPGSGAERLFTDLLTDAGMSVDSLNLTDTARTESEAATTVLEGRADIAFGLHALADQYGLGFAPLLTERFDLLVDANAWFEPPMQTLMEFTRSADFLARASQLRGYDVSDLGRVRHNGVRL